MSSSASMSMLLGSLSVLCCARRGEQRAAQTNLRGRNSDVSEQACLSRERENGMPLVSFGPSGIGGEYQVELGGRRR